MVTFALPILVVTIPVKLEASSAGRAPVRFPEERLVRLEPSPYSLSAVTEPPADTVVQLILLLIPSMVTDAGPTVRIPVTLASPSTYNL